MEDYTDAIFDENLEYFKNIFSIAHTVINSGYKVLLQRDNKTVNVIKSADRLTEIKIGLESLLNQKI